MHAQAAAVTVTALEDRLREQLSEVSEELQDLKHSHQKLEKEHSDLKKDFSLREQYHLSFQAHFEDYKKKSESKDAELSAKLKAVFERFDDLEVNLQKEF